jgi:hypothetical protein
MSRVVELLKGAVDLNLRYGSSLLQLSKGYVLDAAEVLSRTGSAAAAPAAQATSAAPAATPAATKSPARAPLLVAGRSGDLANAAFAINNPGSQPVQGQLLVQGELGAERVRLDPAHFSLQPGQGLIVRIVVPIDDQLRAEHDHLGAVVVPGLSAEAVPFIVRRLAAAEPIGPA